MKALCLTLLLIMSANIASATPTPPLKMTWDGSEVSAFIYQYSAKSCYQRTDPSNSNSQDNDVKENLLELDNFKLEWSDTESDLYINSITLILNDSHLKGGTAVIMITDNELASLNGTHGQWNKSIAHIFNPTRPSKFSASCPLLFGGIAFELNEDFSTVATVQLDGYQHNYHGPDTAFRFQKEITIYSYSR